MTRKEKFIKSLKDWKTWVFSVIPLIAMIVSVIVFAISSEEDQIGNYGICLAVVFYASAIGRIPDIIAMFKRKTKRTTILAMFLIVLLVAFIVFTMFCFWDLLKVGVMETQCEILHQEYLQVDPADTELAEQKHDVWRAALREMREIKSSIEWKISGACLAYAFGILVVACLDKKDEENKADDNPSQNSTVIH